MRKKTNRFFVFTLLCMTLVSCNGMTGNKKEYSDSIVVTYHQGLTLCDDCNLDYERMGRIAATTEPTDTIELSSRKFYALKSKLTDIGEKKDYVTYFPISMKWDTLSVCFNDDAVVINKDECVVDISLDVIHEILTLSKYYDGFVSEDLEYMATIQKFGIPSEYHFTPYMGFKLMPLRKVFLVPVSESDEKH